MSDMVDSFWGLREDLIYRDEPGKNMWFYPGLPEELVAVMDAPRTINEEVIVDALKRNFKNARQKGTPALSKRLYYEAASLHLTCLGYKGTVICTGGSNVVLFMITAI